MLTDRKLKSIKPSDKPYKVSDRDGLYIYVTKKGTISFRYDYTFNKKRSTIVFGQYGFISLSEAREALINVKKLIKDSIDPSLGKREKTQEEKEDNYLNYWASRYLSETKFADSTRKLRTDTYQKNMSSFGNLAMNSITTLEIRQHCEKIKENGAPSTALLVRELFGAIYRFAIDRGLEVSNPAENIKGSSIATFSARERSLTPREVGIFFNFLEQSEAYYTIKKGLRFIAITLVRKGELVNAKWDEINFDDMLWSIPASRMKAGRAHNIYLPTQTMDLLIAFKMFSEDSEYILPSRTNNEKPISMSSLNRVLNKTVEQINSAGIAFEPFTVHDFRRTGSTLLNEMGFNTDWIEKSLAHEQKGIRAVYNRAEYAEQRKDMMQQWADMIDTWIDEQK